MAEKAKQLLNIILITILVVATIAGLIWISSTYSLSIAKGNSMLPTFSSCTILLANKSIAPQDVQIDNIAIIDISEQHKEFSKIVHRVVMNDAELQQLATKADNVSIYEFPDSIDGFFDYSKYEGTVERYWNLSPDLCGGST